MDMLVKLYELPDATPYASDLQRAGIVVRRAMVHERHKVVAWVSETFGAKAAGWVDECTAAFARQPVACHIAVRSGAVVGFACYDTTARGMFGPIGVGESARSNGIGRLLLLASLRDMHVVGYAYAVVGHVANTTFFAKAAGAVAIEGSTPGPYPSDSALV